MFSFTRLSFDEAFPTQPPLEQALLGNLVEQLTAATVGMTPLSRWTDREGVYYNAETGKRYRPHHELEAQFVFSDTPANAACIGSEGSGKSVAGIVKNLERLRRGMSGIMVSPDLPHFKKSLWPEFRKWCPWDSVVPSQRYRKSFAWEPGAAFLLAFSNGATLLCGGIEEPMSWEGGNVSFAHIDEARRCKDANALKVLKGRVRIPGRAGEPPQFYVTTTPRLNWLYTYFGWVLAKCDKCGYEFKESDGLTPAQFASGVCPRCEEKRSEE